MKKKYIFLLIIFVIGIRFGTYILTPEQTKLKFFNANDIDPQLVDSALHGLGGPHRVSSFSFLNQDGKVVSDETVSGKVYVVDYFFTTCGSICPIMTGQMRRIQVAFIHEDDLLILSHTVWPEVDSVPQMKKYALEKGVKSGKWHLLTGEKEKLYELARKSYFVLKPAEAENTGDGNSDFIHTNNFVLVDRERRIRGYYDGTDSTEVSELIVDIQSLLDE